MARKTKLLMKRSLMLIMSLAVALTILPKVGQNVYAAEESKMENGTVDVTVNDAPETTTVVNYGGYSWYVIKDEMVVLSCFLRMLILAQVHSVLVRKIQALDMQRMFNLIEETQIIQERCGISQLIQVNQKKIPAGQEQMSMKEAL